jgi:uncharacterized membrane protein
MEDKNTEEQDSNLEKHPKQDFQVERLAFFSDAVFAIAITLLVIEFKVPQITDTTTYSDVLQQLFDLKYHFFALLLSFFLIATYWMQHHRLFKYIHNYNTSIIVANMFVLLPIIFFPFTTTFWAESIVSLKENIANQEIYALGFRLFFLNNFFAASATLIFYWLAIVKYKKLSFEMPMQEKIGFISVGLFKVTFFAVLSVVTFFTYTQVLIPMLVMFLLRKLFSKKIAEKLAKK